MKNFIVKPFKPITEFAGIPFSATFDPETALLNWGEVIVDNGEALDGTKYNDFCRDATYCKMKGLIKQWHHETMIDFMKDIDRFDRVMDVRVGDVIAYDFMNMVQPVYKSLLSVTQDSVYLSLRDGEMIVHNGYVIFEQLSYSTEYITAKDEGRGRVIATAPYNALKRSREHREVSEYVEAWVKPGDIIRFHQKDSVRVDYDVFRVFGKEYTYEPRRIDMNLIMCVE